VIGTTRRLWFILEIWHGLSQVRIDVMLHPVLDDPRTTDIRPLLMVVIYGSALVLGVAAELESEQLFHFFVLLVRLLDQLQLLLALPLFSLEHMAGQVLNFAHSRLVQPIGVVHRLLFLFDKQVVLGC